MYAHTIFDFHLIKLYVGKGRKFKCSHLSAWGTFYVKLPCDITVECVEFQNIHGESHYI